MYSVKRILPQPGVQKDGTEFDSESWIDGKWIRFYKNLPRSMGGYKLIDEGSTEIVRNLYQIPQQNQNGETTVDIYFGRPSSLKYINFAIEPTGLEGFAVDRTPGGFVASPENVWDFELFTADDGSGNLTSFLIAHAAPNGNNLNSNVEGQVYYGRIDDNLILVDLHRVGDDAAIKCSGGILVVGPFLMVYGNDGIIRWAKAGTLNQFPDENILRINGGKVIQGMRVKGGGNPTALFWTLTSLVKVSYNPDLQTFVEDTVEDGITILSPDSVIKYDNTFFWIGTDQFYMYNGVVQRLPNTFNSDYFFDNINIQAREKVWGIALPRFKELWFFAPINGSTECNHLFICNLDTGTWYDTPLSRTCGMGPSFFPYPLLCDAESSPDRVNPPEEGELLLTYPLWMHEYGVDKVMYNRVLAIESYIESNLMTLASENPQNDRQMRIRRIIPDFVQTGDLEVQVIGRQFPNANVFVSPTYTFNKTTEKVDTNFQASIVSIRFISNAANSFFQMGNVLINYEEGDKRPGG